MLRVRVCGFFPVWLGGLGLVLFGVVDRFGFDKTFLVTLVMFMLSKNSLADDSTVFGFNIFFWIEFVVGYASGEKLICRNFFSRFPDFV